MNFLKNNDSYGAVKILTYMMGFWPYQNSAERYFCGALSTLVCCVVYVPEIFAAIEFYDDREVILELIAPFMTNIVSITKFIVNMYNQNLIKSLFDQIKIDLKSYPNENECAIIQSHTRFGKLLAHGYIGISILTVINVTVASDIMFIVLLHHAAGLFAVTGMAGQWYITSPRVQKLVTLVTLRSQLPCKLTAGKIMVLSLETFTSFLAIWAYRDNKQVVLECFAPYLINFYTTAKFLTNVCNHEQIRKLIDQAKFNLQNCKTKGEYDILQYYSEIGNVLAAGWAGVVYIGTFCYVFEPLTPLVLSFIFNFNNTAPLEFSIPLYFFGINAQKYYFEILLSTGFFIFILMNITIASDSIFIILLVHVSGLFAATGYLMSHIPTQEDIKNGTLPFDIDVPLTLENIQYKHFITLETTTVQKLVKYLVFGGAQIIHLFFDCALSQKLIDFSTNIQEYLATGLWYDTPKKVQKLIVLVTLRSQLACKLTAGKILVLSLETFTTFVKTAASYFTVLASMQ
ncbi:uncharacterized protein [Chelonus insularis]|uniref:uncharacterized protein n=1 Tax=Chelonus insularis TaxID=460826 RepID=UPI001589856E|nr:uncharacterized protein LOC118066450 [Chelonus insularis]